MSRYSHHERGYDRRSYKEDRGGGGYRRKRVEEDGANVRYKLVKLGDQPDRLLLSIKDVCGMLDSFLTHDYNAFAQMIVSREMEMDLTSPFADASFDLSDWMHTSSLNTESLLPGRLPSVDLMITTVVKCMKHIPHKHSYYVCLFWFMLWDALHPEGLNDATRPSDLKNDLLNVLAQWGAGVPRVKGEIAEADGGPVESGNHLDSATQRRSNEYRERTLFYYFVVTHVVRRLWLELRKLVHARSGLHRLSEIYSCLRVLADFANTGIVDPCEMLGICESLCLNRPVEEHQAAACELLLGGTTLMWLSSRVYVDHQTRFDDLVGKISERCATIAAAHPPSPLLAANGILAGSGEQVTNSSPSDLQSFAEALASLQERHWQPKALPRLYESAKLQHIDRAAFNVPLKLHSHTLVVKRNIETMDEGSVRDPPRTADAPATTPTTHTSATLAIERDWPAFAAPVAEFGGLQHIVSEAQLWKPPPAELVWRMDAERRSVFRVFDDDYVASQLEVVAMRPCDIFVLGVYIEHVLASYCTDLDLCAETLLAIPCRHDHFLLVLLNRVFELVFSPTPVLCAFTRVYLMNGSFLALLLRRLCILERSCLPHVQHALRFFLDHAETLSEFATHTFVDFASLWLASTEPETAEHACLVLLTHPAVMPYLESDPRALKAETEVELSDHRPTTQLWTPQYSETSAVRSVVLVCQRTARLLCPSESFATRVRYAALRRLAPQLDVYSFDPRTHFLFCAPDDESRCRIPGDLEDMKRLRFESKAPLEATLLRDLLHLQAVADTRRGCVVVREATALLKALVGNGFMQSLRAFSKEQLEELIVKAEGAWSGIKGERGTLVKTEDEDASLVELTEPPSTLLTTQTFPTFEASDWAWTPRRLSRLLSLVLTSLGARTMSHFFKMLELYTPMVKLWKAHLIRSRRLDDGEEVVHGSSGEERLSEVQIFELLLCQHTAEVLSPTNSAARVQACLFALVNRDCVSVGTLVRFLTATPKELRRACGLKEAEAWARIIGDDLAALDTLTGEAIFFPLVDLIIGNFLVPPSFSSAASRNVMKSRPTRRIDDDAQDGVKMDEGGVKIKSEGDQLRATRPDTATYDPLPCHYGVEDAFEVVNALLAFLQSRLTTDRWALKKIVRLLLTVNPHFPRDPFSQLLSRLVAANNPSLAQVAAAFQ